MKKVKNEFKLTINPEKIIRLLFLITIGLTLLSLTSRLYLNFILNTDLNIPFKSIQLLASSFFDKFFNLDAEMNLPTFYSSLLLICNSMLFCIITFINKVKKDEKIFYWLILAITFLYLSIDEFCSLHERFGHFLSVATKMKTYGFFYFNWVIVAIPLCLIFALFFIPYLLKLPKKIAGLIFLSGIIYVSGSIGMEMIGANYYSIHRGTGYIYPLLTTIEESMEMIGASTLIYTLFSYIKLLKIDLNFSFD